MTHDTFSLPPDDTEDFDPTAEFRFPEIGETPALPTLYGYVSQASQGEFVALPRQGNGYIVHGDREREGMRQTIVDMGLYVKFVAPWAKLVAGPTIEMSDSQGSFTVFGHCHLTGSYRNDRAATILIATNQRPMAAWFSFFEALWDVLADAIKETAKPELLALLPRMSADLSKEGIEDPALTHLFEAPGDRLASAFAAFAMAELHGFVIADKDRQENEFGPPMVFRDAMNGDLAQMIRDAA